MRNKRPPLEEWLDDIKNSAAGLGVGVFFIPPSSEIGRGS